MSRESSAPKRRRLRVISDEEDSCQLENVFGGKQEAAACAIVISDDARSKSSEIIVTSSDEPKVKPKKTRKTKFLDAKEVKKPRRTKKAENAANNQDALAGAIASNEEGTTKQRVTKKQDGEDKEKKEKPKKRGKVRETNEQVIENLFQKSFVMAEEPEVERKQLPSDDDDPMQERREEFGLIEDKPKKQRQQKAKNIHQVIKNRHKFFTQFDDDDEPMAIVEKEEEVVIDGPVELKFERQQQLKVDQKAQRQVQKTVQEYRQIVSILDKAQQNISKAASSKMIEELPHSQSDIYAPNPRTVQQPVSEILSSRQCEELQFSQPMLLKQQSVQQGPSQNPLFRKTLSMGIKRGLSTTLEEDFAPEIALEMPKIQGVNNPVLEATLFMNKVKMQGFQKFAAPTTVGGNANSLGSNSMNLASSRNGFHQMIQSKQQEQRKTKLKFDEMLERIQCTTYEELEKKKKQEEQEKEKERELRGQEDDDSSFDDDFVPDEKHPDNSSNGSESGSESKQANDSNEELDNEDQGEQDEEERCLEPKQKRQENDILIEREAQESENALDKGFCESQNQESSQQRKDSKILGEVSGAVMELEEKNDAKQLEGPSQNQNQSQATLSQNFQPSDLPVAEDDEDFIMFKRLKNLAIKHRQRKLKEQQMLERRMIREQKRKEYEKIKKFINSEFVEHQAEVGSDNESHDDVVKKCQDSEEDDENEAPEQELLDMIDDKLPEYNEENEQFAFRMFMERLYDQEKEEIRKIRNGEFRTRDGKTHRVDLNELELTEAEKLRMIDSRKRESDGEGSYNSDEMETVRRMNKEQRREYLREKRQQKLLEAELQMKQQAKRNRKDEMQLYDPEVLKMIEKKMMKQKPQPKPSTENSMRSNSFRQFCEAKKMTMVNENSNMENSNHFRAKKQKNGTYLNRLLSENLGKGGMLGQQLQKSPNKMVMFNSKK